MSAPRCDFTQWLNSDLGGRGRLFWRRHFPLWLPHSATVSNQVHMYYVHSDVYLEVCQENFKTHPESHYQRFPPLYNDSKLQTCKRLLSADLQGRFWNLVTFNPLASALTFSLILSKTMKSYFAPWPNTWWFISSPDRLSKWSKKRQFPDLSNEFPNPLKTA